jgi:hypothetical protein
MEKELKNESEEELKNESEELNVYIEKNENNERCEYTFLGSNLKFIFRKNNDISKEFFGKLTENSALFFIIFTTCWCCFTEFNIILPVILDKKTTYQEVMDNYTNSVNYQEVMDNSVKTDNNPIKRIESWNNYNNDEKIDINDIKLGLNNLRAFIYILYDEYKDGDDCHIIRITMEDALELNSKPDIYGCKGAIDYETLKGKYRLSSKKE